MEESAQKTEIPNIWLIPSGEPSPNPVELLNSVRMQNLISGMQKGFDFIFLDTPPVLFLADTLVVSSQAEALVLIVQPEKTKKKHFSNAAEKLRQNNIKILGTLLNQAKLESVHDYKPDY